jgi:hypothetical protein
MSPLVERVLLSPDSDEDDGNTYSRWVASWSRLSMVGCKAEFRVVNSSIVRGPDDSRTLGKIRVDEKHFIDSAALRYELAISRLWGSLHRLKSFRWSNASTAMRYLELTLFRHFAFEFIAVFHFRGV